MIPVGTLSRTGVARRGRQPQRPGWAENYDDGNANEWTVHNGRTPCHHVTQMLVGEVVRPYNPNIHVKQNRCNTTGRVLSLPK